MGYRILHKTAELNQLTKNKNKNNTKTKSAETFNNKKQSILKLSTLKAIETFNSFEAARRDTLAQKSSQIAEFAAATSPVHFSA